MTTDYPPRLDDGRIYLTEGGTETEVMYKWGFELPEFSMYPLFDDPDAMAAIDGMFNRYFEAAAAHDSGILLGGMDYRASPDWARKIGYSLDQLKDFIHRNVAFLQEKRERYSGRVRDVVVTGCIGPRGDAYGAGGDITAEESEEYHTFQLEALKSAGADMATAATFNNIPESIGIIRAAQAVGIPIGVSLTVTSDGVLRSGPSLKHAVIEIDRHTNGAANWLGTNCAHPLEFEPALSNGGDWIGRLRYFRPNASKAEKLSLCKLGHLEDGDPVELGGQMAALRQRLPNADIIGGCCGTDERHLVEIARQIAA